MQLETRITLRILVLFRIFPNIFLAPMPLEIYEFHELLRGVKFSKEELILDIGCGNGLQTLLLGKKCKKVIGIDTSEEAIIVARHRASFVKRRINSEFRCTRIEEDF